MQLQAAKNITINLFNESLRTSHSRFMTLAALVSACYLPSWIWFLLDSVWHGQSYTVLNFGAIAVGIKVFVQNRKALADVEVQGDDRFLGYTLTILGMIALALFRGFNQPLTFQYLSAMMIFLGMIWSTWGIFIFQKFPFTLFLVLLGLYPNLFFIAMQTCKFLTPDESLERVMAWAGSQGLNLIGYQSVAKAAYVILPQGSIVIWPACSGFEMMFILSGVSVLVAQFMKLSWKKGLALIAFGWSMAALMNVPRIMLLAIAIIFWGKPTFDFWHGPIGGQIFSCFLFTLYYYGAEAIIKYKKSATS
jgi:exosortase/archaeosortase family protein